MSDFSTIVADVLANVNRPATEAQVLAKAKRSVNNAIMWLQRNHAYRFTDALVQFTYPANTFKINLTEVCSGTLRDIVSVQQLGTETAVSGQILKQVSYTQIQAMRRKYQYQQPAVLQEVGTLDPLSHDIFTGRVDRHFVFRVGVDVGLYPAPTADVFILMHAHMWLPLLVADADTNFFLTYGYDVVEAVATKFMNRFMKEDGRTELDFADVASAVSTLIALDSQIHESNITELT